MTASKIDRSTLVPIGVAFSALVVVFAAWGFLDSRFTDIDKALDKQDRRLEKLEDRSNERWTQTDMQLWEAKFKNLNPSLKFPE